MKQYEETGSSLSLELANIETENMDKLALSIMKAKKGEYKMRKIEDKIHHGYVCHTGCGHTTLTDKHYKTKRTHCAVCGTKTEMKYLGEFKIEKANKFPEGVIDFGLS